MNIQIESLIGLWRARFDNDIIDMLVGYRDDRESVWCLFTFYEQAEEAVIYFEWKGTIQILNQDNELSQILITDIREYQNQKEDIRDKDYQFLKKIRIWSFNENEMYLKFENRVPLSFQKLGLFAD